MQIPQYISHLFQDYYGQWHFQSNEDHSNGVADLAAKFAAEFGMSEWGRLIGLLHDRGKESSGFQAHIKKSSGFEPHAMSDVPSAHSAIGAKIANQHKMDVLHWLSNPIAGHHRGLYNDDELELVINQTDVGAVNDKLPMCQIENQILKAKLPEMSHIVRMLYSCLVDADWLDTERFMNPRSYDRRGHHATIPQLKEMMDKYRNNLASLPVTSVNAFRNAIQEECEKCGSLSPGFFNLTVPTGGGKTIASLIWALNHALVHGKKRIILAIPFTSIIVQTAHVLKEIFGENNVIEHHSALDPTVLTPDGEETSPASLACENWDAPIVVTTNVQLFESMFASSRSRCRKLHSLCNSVVILDEVQTLPLKFYQPVIDAMQCYARHFGTSFLMCTASQPVLEGERKGAGRSIFNGLPQNEIKQIIPAGMDLHSKLRRVEISFDRAPISVEDLARRVASHKRVLCVVNTRRLAREVHDVLHEMTCDCFHLSRLMCQAHILATIDLIKERLTNPDAAVRVVSTQLIEAGVDIDFPAVLRQLTGLDSVLQAAGRCNREGTLERGHVEVFEVEGYKAMGELNFATDAMRDLLSLHPQSDWLDPAMMKEYFTTLYAKTPSFDAAGIKPLLEEPRNCQYEEAATRFHIIDDNRVNVIVNYSEADDLVGELKRHGPSRTLSRKLGRYCVGVDRRLLNEMFRQGLVEQPCEGFFYIPDKVQYSDKYGLSPDSHFLTDLCII